MGLDYSLSAFQPIDLEKSEFILTVPKSEKYEIQLIIEYMAPTPCKFFANLYPDIENRDLHRLGAHFDTVSSYGSPVSGNGKLEFALYSIAPSPSWLQSKKFPKRIVIGLMDYEKWMTTPPFCTREYSFTLKTF
jgi:hypothetical protein